MSMKPFADDRSSMTIGGLSAENGTTVVALSGSLDVRRDKEGLRLARALLEFADALVRELEAADLPDRVGDGRRPTDDVPNPFA